MYDYNEDRDSRDPTWRPKIESTEQADRELARLCRALAHPARVRILRELVKGRELECGRLVAVLPLAQSTVSQHLKTLQLAGWIEVRPEGQRRLYRVRRLALERLQVLGSALARQER
jgi:ArsR family transcriptional regulator